MQGMGTVFFALSAMMTLSLGVNAQVTPGSASPATHAYVSASTPAATPTPAPAAVPSPTTMPGSPVSTAPPAQAPSSRVSAQFENSVPSAPALESGRMNYARYCADCHGKDGEGKTGPKLIGSLIVTGPVYGHLNIVLNGHNKSIMPTWGISEISDAVIASVITYQRNAWGNSDKKEYGKHAGGVVTPEWVHVYRKLLKNLPVKQEVRT